MVSKNEGFIKNLSIQIKKHHHLNNMSLSLCTFRTQHFLMHNVNMVQSMHADLSPWMKACVASSCSSCPQQPAGDRLLHGLQCLLSTSYFYPNQGKQRGRIGFHLPLLLLLHLQIWPTQKVSDSPANLPPPQLCLGLATHIQQMPFLLYLCHVIPPLWLYWAQVLPVFSLYDGDGHGYFLGLRAEAMVKKTTTLFPNREAASCHFLRLLREVVSSWHRVDVTLLTEVA